MTNTNLTPDDIKLITKACDLATKANNTAANLTERQSQYEEHIRAVLSDRVGDIVTKTAKKAISQILKDDVKSLIKSVNDKKQAADRMPFNGDDYIAINFDADDVTKQAKSELATELGVMIQAFAKRHGLDGLQINYQKVHE